MIQLAVEINIIVLPRKVRIPLGAKNLFLPALTKIIVIKVKGSG